MIKTVTNSLTGRTFEYGTPEYTMILKRQQMNKKNLKAKQQRIDDKVKFADKEFADMGFKFNKLSGMWE